MDMKQAKQQIIRILEEQQVALSSQELLSLLGEDTNIRSVRRWLSELVADNRIVRVGRGPMTRYQREKRIASNFVFSEQAGHAIEMVNQPLIHRVPVSYNMDWFESYVPNKSRYLSSADIDSLRQQGARNEADEAAGTYARHVYNRLLIDLSYNSSRLEGNTYSLLDTEKLVLEGLAVQGKLDEEKIMILNHKETIRYLVDAALKITIDYDHVCTIHYLLSDGLVAAKYAGHVRDHGVRISQSVYIPYEHPDKLELQLQKLCEKATRIHEPFEQSVFLLVNIAYLQPFIDVNKRTSRLCANIPLIKDNYVPLSFNDVDKDDYTAAMLAIYELNNVRPLVELYKYSYQRTCQQYAATVESLGFDEVRVRYRSERRELIAKIISKQLIGKELEMFIEKQSLAIPEAERVDFIDDLQEDLTYISPAKIAGLGVSLAELNEWLKLKNKE